MRGWESIEPKGVYAVFARTKKEAMELLAKVRHPVGRDYFNSHFHETTDKQSWLRMFDFDFDIRTATPRVMLGPDPYGPNRKHPWQWLQI